MIALRAHQEQIIATQTQHTAILRQIQHHLGILSTTEHPIPILSENVLKYLLKTRDYVLMLQGVEIV